jgi:dihydropteroate synthase
LSPFGGYLQKRVSPEPLIKAGAEFINDISGLHFDDRMAEVVAEGRAGLFLMHSRGRPATMQQDTILRESDRRHHCLFARRPAPLRRMPGLPEERLAVDPGIGFGKNSGVISKFCTACRNFIALGRPVLLGNIPQKLYRAGSWPEGSGRSAWSAPWRPSRSELRPVCIFFGFTMCGLPERRL